MRLELELPSDLEAKLTAEAEEVGVPLADYVVRILSSIRVGNPVPANGPELLAYWQEQGLIGGRPDITDSATHARKLREKAQKRELP